MTAVMQRKEIFDDGLEDVTMPPAHNRLLAAADEEMVPAVRHGAAQRRRSGGGGRAVGGHFRVSVLPMRYLFGE